MFQQVGEGFRSLILRGLRKVLLVITHEMDLPPGVIVELYRRRWEAEKVFDQIKNKLGEKKAWATSLVAKEAQAQLVAITHNLLLLYEQTI
jgi:IS4 transposase